MTLKAIRYIAQRINTCPILRSLPMDMARPRSKNQYTSVTWLMEGWVSPILGW